MRELVVACQYSVCTPPRTRPLHLYTEDGTLVAVVFKGDEELAFQLATSAEMYAALRRAHDALDDINADVGPIDDFCKFCQSNELDGDGVVHTEDCVVREARLAIAAAEAGAS